MKGKRTVFLIGFMGSGKTTVGRKLADMWDAEFADTDEMIEAAEGISVKEIFSRYGESYFRDLETGLLEKMAVSNQRQRHEGDGGQVIHEGDGGRQGKLVVSVGGGLPLREKNRALMRRIGCVFFLTAGEDTLVRRLTGSQDRPLLLGMDLPARIRELAKARLDFYLDAADEQVRTDDRQPEEIAEEIIRRMAETV